MQYILFVPVWFLVYVVDFVHVFSALIAMHVVLFEYYLVKYSLLCRETCSPVACSLLRTYCHSYGNSVATCNRIMQTVHVHYILQVKCQASKQSYFEVAVSDLFIILRGKICSFMKR